MDAAREIIDSLPFTEEEAFTVSDTMVFVEGDKVSFTLTFY